MTKILVDTSVWIDALNGTKNWQANVLEQLIDANAPVVLCPVIVQEILQGIKADTDSNLVKENLSGFEMLHTDAVEAAHGAATLYRNTRKRGITIRKSNDCLIAFYAIYHDVLLLHNDEDFNKIADHTELKILNNSNSSTSRKK